MKKSKTETAVVGGVLGENNKKISDIERSIRAALDRKRKIIMESKLYIYGQLSELFGGIEGQELLDAVTKEHTLIGKLTASGMTYDQIAELADDKLPVEDSPTFWGWLLMLNGRIKILSPDSLIKEYHKVLEKIVSQTS